MPDKRFKLLIAGDDGSIQRSVPPLFSEELYCVGFADDNAAALSNIQQEIPDTLLSDLDIPGTSGIEFLLEVRRRFPSIRVIAMSYEFSGSCMPLGVAADAFFEKGADMAILVELVAAMTEPERSTRRLCMDDLFGFQMFETIPPHPGPQQRTHSSGSPLRFSAPRMSKRLEYALVQE